VRNAIHILRARLPPTPQLQWARDVIDRQVTQMARLIDDLMDVSRITRGTFELRRERVSLADIVRLAVETSRPGIDASGDWGDRGSRQPESSGRSPAVRAAAPRTRPQW